MTNALEEVADNHLYANEWEHQDVDTEPMVGHQGDFFVVREQMCQHMGTELAHDEACKNDNFGTQNGEPQRLPNTWILLGSPVVAHDGLHALVQSHHHHDEQEHYTIHNAIGRNGCVAAVLQHTFIYEQHDQAGAQVHEERTHAHGNDLADDGWAEVINASV